MSHCATYSPEVLQAACRTMSELVASGLLPKHPRTLDPFGGTGKAHLIAPWTGARVISVDLEPAEDWGDPVDPTWDCRVGDATDLRTAKIRASSIDCIMTSCCYGNRMADTYDGRDGSKRATYTLSLGRPPSEGSAAVMQWGPDYQKLHARAWREAYRVTKPGGRFLLNISDHVRDKRLVPVSAWHTMTATRAGWEWCSAEPIYTQRNRFGANGTARAEHEWLIGFRKGRE